MKSDSFAKNASGCGNAVVHVHGHRVALVRHPEKGEDEAGRSVYTHRVEEEKAVLVD